MDDPALKPNPDGYSPFTAVVPTFQSHRGLPNMEQVYFDNRYADALQNQMQQPFTSLFQGAKNNHDALRSGFYLLLNQPSVPVGSNGLVAQTVSQTDNASWSPVHGMASMTLNGEEGSNEVRYKMSRCQLPSWVMAGDQVIVSLQLVLQSGLLVTFATDKIGCHFLQENFPSNAEPFLRRDLYEQIFGDEEVFLRLSHDVFGNFIVQKLVESAMVDEIGLVLARLETRGKLVALAQHRYSCRVVQAAIDHLPMQRKTIMLLGMRGFFARLAVDQNANHVVQRVLKTCPFAHPAFIMIIDEFISSESILFTVIENKYGCRVIQVALEVLSATRNSFDDQLRKDLLERLTVPLVIHCKRFTKNEYANYIIQHVLETPELMTFADRIVNDCVLNKILNLSQEKFASHVVEKAIRHASPRFFRAMAEEIFEGYFPDAHGRTALDILLFDQFGNYVVQTLLDKLAAHMKGIPRLNKWFDQLVSAIEQHRERLNRYSSGKKILEQLRLAHQQSSWPFDFNADDAFSG